MSDTQVSQPTPLPPAVTAASPSSAPAVAQPAAEAGQERLTPGGYMSIPWQRPELAPRQGTARPASDYADMIAAGTGTLPPTIRAEAMGRMVDFAAPDIVLPDRPGSERSYLRSVAVGGLGQVTAETVADLYSRRSIRQDDAERFIGDAVTLADWARGRALGAGLTPDQADQAADLSNALKSVEWGRGHPDAEDGLTMDHAGREAASKAAVAFAERGPVQASLASMMVDVETSPDVVGGFSMGQIYVRDEDRVQGLQSRGVDRSNPGASLVAPPDQAPATQAAPPAAGTSAQPANPEGPRKPEQEAAASKEDEFRKLVLQLGDIAGDLKDEALTLRINKLVNAIGVPGRSESPDYRTAVAYVVQDVEKEIKALRMPGALRAEMGHLAATYPGLQNVQMQALVASTPEIGDKTTVRAIRAAAAEVARQPDQQTAEVTSRIDALANRVRLSTDATPEAPAQPASGPGAQQPTAARVAAATPVVQAESGMVVAASPRPRAAEPNRVMLDVMTAFRRPEPDAAAPWDKQLTPMGDRITAYNTRMQAGGEEADMKRAERTGAIALTAMKEFTDGPGAVLMTRIRDAAKADPDGMTGVLSEMREGGRYAGLRQDLTVSLQHERFAAAYDKALASVTAFGTARAEIDKFAGQRPDAAVIAGRFQKLDAEIGKAASELPSRTEGRSFTDELAQRAQEAVMRAVEVVINAFNRLRGASAGPSATPS